PEVADVNQYGGPRPVFRIGPHSLDNFFSEYVFVANVGSEALAYQVEMLLARLAAIEVAQWNMHGIDEPSEAGRYKLAERYQVVFVVTHAGLTREQSLYGSGAVESHDAIGVAVARRALGMQGNPHDDGGVAFLCDAAPLFPDLPRIPVLE